MKKRPTSANGDKYLTQSIKYIYSPVKKRDETSNPYQNKIISIQSSIDRVLSAINK